MWQTWQAILAAGVLLAALKVKRGFYLRWAVKQDPQLIYQQLTAYEFPFLWRKALELALFRTYSIPSISRLLVATQEFKLRPGKRYEDTDLIIEEAILCPMGSERSDRAFKRLNEIHGMYKIAHEDFLYVLTTFVVVPKRMLDEFGWRRLTQQEAEAVALVWIEFGRRMELKVDVFTCYADMEKYLDKYEAERMVYAETNQEVSESTTQLFLSIYPRMLHGSVRTALAALQDDRLRAANGTKAAPLLVSAAIHGLLRARAWVLWLLAPPNYFPSGCRLMGGPFVPTTGSAAAAASGKGGSSGGHCSFRGGVCPVPDGLLKCKYEMYEKVYPNGYRIEELGPVKTQ